MKISVTDQMNRKVEIPFPPKRIVSLVPSQSELLWDLGLQSQLVGITKFCIHPNEMFTTIKRIGGTKKIHLEEIESLNPDLIIGNKEENTVDDISALEKKFPVWMSDVNTYEQAMDMLTSMGEITDTVKTVNQLIVDIQNEFRQIQIPKKPVNALYLIWKNPYMCVGRDTFIHSMIQKSGIHNLMVESRYPEITVEQIKKIDPQLLILSTEPYPFTEKDVEYFMNELPYCKVWLADGEMFSWYGSRLKKSARYFIRHQHLFSA